MQLSKENLAHIQKNGVSLPPESVFELPEKVMQFGTGVLLRGLPDYFIDKANRQGLFNGRIVVVKSTAAGNASEFDRQDNLYTLCVKGIDQGKQVEENILCSAISRVLSAATQWKSILEYACHPELQVVISNTTEVGLNLQLESIDQQPPASFPAKLLAVLKRRFDHFQGSAASGLVIIPTELIPDNGNKLKSVLIKLADHNQLDRSFMHWMLEHNRFCNSLVDRIVPGKPNAETIHRFQNQFGYEDDLLTVAEVYRLWAIEGDEKVRSVLSFEGADEGVIIAEDIEIYRELKLRLLNGTHTLSCGVAFLAGVETVSDAMNNSITSGFISHLMKKEIAPSIPYRISTEEKNAFAESVLDRFRNPHIRHLWINITVQYSAKLKMRVLQVLLEHYKNHQDVPFHIAFGFAAWLVFMRVKGLEGTEYFGEWNNTRYPVKDDQAAYFLKEWERSGESGIVTNVLSNEALWGTNLVSLPGFAEAVEKNLQSILHSGVFQSLSKLS
jgi:tagaturonate reductase